MRFIKDNTRFWVVWSDGDSSEYIYDKETHIFNKKNDDNMCFDNIPIKTYNELELVISRNLDLIIHYSIYEF